MTDWTVHDSVHRLNVDGSLLSLGLATARVEHVKPLGWQYQSHTLGSNDYGYANQTLQQAKYAAQMSLAEQLQSRLGELMSQPDECWWRCIETPTDDSFIADMILDGFTARIFTGAMNLWEWALLYGETEIVTRHTANCPASSLMAARMAAFEHVQCAIFELARSALSLTKEHR